jgi:hypothetical protein
VPLGNGDGASARTSTTAPAPGCDTTVGGAADTSAASTAASPAATPANGCPADGDGGAAGIVSATSSASWVDGGANAPAASGTPAISTVLAVVVTGGPPIHSAASSSQSAATTGAPAAAASSVCGSRKVAVAAFAGAGAACRSTPKRTLQPSGAGAIRPCGLSAVRRTSVGWSTALAATLSSTS